MNRLLILGGGGHGRVVADIARLNGYEDIGFLDDSTDCGNLPFPRLGKCGEAVRYVSDGDFIVAIGNAAVRRTFQERIAAAGGNLVTLVHPRAVVASSAVIGRGSVVMAGAVINPDARIGKGVIINTAGTVDHDCEVGDFAHVSVGAHLCGTVTVGPETWIGAGATVINNISICGSCMIGAGAVVVKDIGQAGTYVGVPAELLEKAL